MTMTETIKFRITKPELDIVDSKASALSLNRSDYIRLALSQTLTLSSSDNATVALDLNTFRLIFREFNRWGTNFNQSTKALNTVASRLRKSTLDDDEKRFIATNSKRSIELLDILKDGLLRLDTQVMNLSERHAIVIPTKTLIRLDGD